METEDSVKARVELLPRKSLIVCFSLFLLAFSVTVASSLFAPGYLERIEIAVNNKKAAYSFDGDLKKQFLFVEGVSSSEFSVDLNVVLIKGNSVVSDSSEEWVCSSDSCPKKLVLYEPFLTEELYSITVDLPEEIDASFYLGFVNEEFTVFQILVTCFFSVLAVLSFVLYSWTLKNVPYSAWSLECKMTLVLSVSLVLFNDPFCFLSIIYPSMWTTALSVSAVSQFFFVLVLFWTTIFIRHLDFPYKMPLYATFIGLTSFTYLLLLGSYLYLDRSFENDPAYTVWDFAVQYKPATVAVFVLVGINGFSVIGLAITGLFSCRIVNLQKQITSVINLIAIALCSIALGVVPVANVGFSGFTMVSFMAFFNFYVYILCFLCAPVKISLYRFESDTPVIELNQNEEVEFSKIFDD